MDPERLEGGTGCRRRERATPDSLEKRVVRGGSWYDRPAGATAASRYAYHPWQKVYDTGFRVIVCPP